MNHVPNKIIAQQIADANHTTIGKLGLRFDKVVQRLMEDVGNALNSSAPKGVTVLVTVTAPIRLPAKTASQILAQVNDLLQSEENESSFQAFGNNICVVVVKTSKKTQSFVGMVHNQDVSATKLLNLMKDWVLHQ